MQISDGITTTMRFRMAGRKFARYLGRGVRAEQGYGHELGLPSKAHPRPPRWLSPGHQMEPRFLGELRVRQRSLWTRNKPHKFI